MRTIKKNDNLVLKADYGFDYRAGTKAVALADWTGPDIDSSYSNLLLVQWEDGEKEQVYGWRFNVVKDVSNVDALIAEYAKRLRKGIDEGTMVAPYSEIGIFASFLMDYNNLESE